MIFFGKVGEACYTALGVLFFLRELLKIAFIVIPIGLILMITIDFLRGTISFKDDPKVIKIVIRRIIYTMVIFLIPSSVFSLFNILEITSNDSKSCWNYAGEVSVNEVKTIINNKREKMNKETQQIREEITERYKIKTSSSSLKTIVSAKSRDGNNTGGNEVVIGQKYNLSSSDLKSLAYVAYKEQGSTKGAAAEATLMANRYELHGSKYSSLKKYVRDSGWFASSKSRIDNPGSVPGSVLTSVKDVLVNGNRTLPLYIDEHDYFGDISKIVTNSKTYKGVSKRIRSHYIPNNTVIYNNMSAVYTFYKFPTSTSDPFGYTKAAKNKIDKLNK